MENRKRSIGLVGTGKIGCRIAKRLVKANLAVVAYDIDKKILESCVAFGVRPVRSPKELALACDIIFLALPNPKIIKDVVTGRDGLLSSGRSELIIVDLSTNSPHNAKEIGKHCESQGNYFVDAPITGGIIGAEKGSLTVMAGGRASSVDRIIPILRLFARKIVHVGPQGHGAAIKLLHNMIGEIQVYAFAEAFCLAARLGLNLDRTYEVLSNGMATSRILTELFANTGLRKQFDPMVTVETAEKDQRLLLEMATGADVRLTFTPIVYGKIQELLSRGFGKEDVTAAISLYEDAFGVKVQISDSILDSQGNAPTT